MREGPGDDPPGTELLPDPVHRAVELFLFLRVHRFRRLRSRRARPAEEAELLTKMNQTIVAEFVEVNKTIIG